MVRGHRMRNDTLGRVMGSVLIVSAYFIIVNVSVTLGVWMNVFGDTLTLPYFIRTKAWDVVVMVCFLLCISVTKLVTVG